MGDRAAPGWQNTVVYVVVFVRFAAFALFALLKSRFRLTSIRYAALGLTLTWQRSPVRAGLVLPYLFKKASYLRETVGAGFFRVGKKLAIFWQNKVLIQHAQFLQERRSLMQDWADYVYSLEDGDNKVVPMNRVKRF